MYAFILFVEIYWIHKYREEAINLPNWSFDINSSNRHHYRLEAAENMSETKMSSSSSSPPVPAGSTRFHSNYRGFYNTNEYNGWITEPTHPDVTGLQSVKWLYPLSLETDYMGDWGYDCRLTWWLPGILSVFYIAFVFGVPKLYPDREPMKLKTQLQAWNLFLAVFSFFGTLRTVPHLLIVLYRYGFRYQVCAPAEDNYALGAVGLWGMLFAHSKYLEFIDTAFLVLRKRNVEFIHWYHHTTVLMFVWHAVGDMQPTGLFFIAMNYFVHTIMYFYYFLAASGIRVSWGICVTVLQISQMIVGMVVVAAHSYYLMTADNAKNTKDNLWARMDYYDSIADKTHSVFDPSVNQCDGTLTNCAYGGVIYGSYFLLFLQFFVKRYFGASGKKASSAVAGKAKKQD